MMSEITTLIPTFQRPQLLQRAVQSVLKQTHGEIRVYIFDNHSKDATRDVVKQMQKLDSRIHYFEREKNIGLVQNFCQAVKHIETPFFHFFSDDDYLFPQFYEIALKGFQAHPEAGVSCCRTLSVDGQGKLLGSQFPHKRFNGYFPPTKGIIPLLQSQSAWTSMLFRKDVLDTLGGLNQHVSTLFDVEFLIKVTARFSVSANPTPGALFLNQGCKQGEILSKYAQDLMRALEPVLKESPNSLQEVKSWVLAMRQAEQRGVWINALRSNDWPSAQKAYNNLFSLDQQKQARLLNFLTWGARYLPFFRHILGVRKIAKQWRQNYYMKRDSEVQKVLSSIEAIFSNKA